MRVTDVYVNNSIGNPGRDIQGQTGVLAQGNGQEQTASAKELANLTPGEVIRGELVTTKEGQVQIKLSNETLLNAKLDQNIALELGKIMNFQVRSNGQSLMLTPLQANLSTDGPVTRALEMANLPVNSATGELTKLMMQAGLSIDKNSLQQVYREMIHQPTGQISDLVDLHRLGLPVTEENLNQIGSYKNLTHQLMSGLENTSAELFQTVTQMQQEDPIGAGQLFQKVLQLMTEGEETADLPAPEQQETSASLKDVPSTSAAEGGNTAQIHQEGQAASSASGTLTPTPIELFEQEIRPSQGQETQGEGLPEQRMKLSKEEYTSAFQTVLTQDGFSEKEKIDFVDQMLKQATSTQNKEMTQALLDTPQVKKLLSDQFTKQWTITPEQVQDPKEVENLYSRLSKQLKGISGALEQAGQMQSPAFQSLSNLDQNIDFLNQLNHMYAYVQLPLKLQQGEAHGDLYVYTNKKNLASKDGPITALLHLDMEHLGPMDIYVTMENSKVGTNFTVANEEILDFLEEHMDLLTARLEKRGYQINVRTSVKSTEKQEETSGIAPILEQARPGYLIQTTKGFDVRT